MISDIAQWIRKIVAREGGDMRSENAVQAGSGAIAPAPVSVWHRGAGQRCHRRSRAELFSGAGQRRIRDKKHPYREGWRRGCPPETARMSSCYRYLRKRPPGLPIRRLGANEGELRQRPRPKRVAVKRPWQARLFKSAVRRVTADNSDRHREPPGNRTLPDLMTAPAGPVEGTGGSYKQPAQVCVRLEEKFQPTR